MNDKINPVAFPGIPFYLYGGQKLIATKEVEEVKNENKRDIVIRCCCKILDIELSELKGNLRLRRYVESRQFLHYFLRKYTKLSYTEIGYITNNDHSTAIHNVKKLTDMFPFYKDMSKMRDEIDNLIKESL